jgi:DHA2 family multidrug resistance protein
MLSPVMALSLQGLKAIDIPQGAGLSNMIRQLGGAVGIAVMNVILVHRNAVNDTYLLQHMNIYNEAFQDRVNQMTQSFVAQGYFLDDAQQLAYKMMDVSLFRQQSLVSYDNIFWMVALAVLFCIPVILLIRDNKKAGAPKVDVHLE